MLAGNVVDVAIERIADGVPVDWHALESGASDEDREFLKCLQVLDGLAGLHRSTVCREQGGRVPVQGGRR